MPSTIITDDDDVDVAVAGGPSASAAAKREAAEEKAKPPMQVAAPPSDIVASIVDGTLDSTDPATLTLGLPDADQLRASGPDRYVSDCLLLLRADYPIFALRRLLALDEVVVAAGLPSLRSRADADRNVAEVLAVEAQMGHTLDTLLSDG